MAESLLAVARRQVKRLYGAEFERKASDALVLGIAQPLTLLGSGVLVGAIFGALPGPVLGMSVGSMLGGQLGSVFRRELSFAGGGACILELAVAEQSEQEVPPEGRGADRRLEAAPSPARPKYLNKWPEGTTARGNRSILSHQESFHRAVGPLREWLGRSSSEGQWCLDGVGSLGGRNTQLCWLNSTIKTLAPLTVLAELAADERVEHIDLPRRLVRAARRAACPVKALGVPSYRRKAKAPITGAGRGVVVAVLDSEVAFRHPLFGDRVILKENYTQEPWGHPNLHGTAVASLAGASDEKIGVAPEVTFYQYKVLAGADIYSADDSRSLSLITKGDVEVRAA